MVANNVVPSRFEVNLNYRFPPTMTVADAEAELAKVTAGADSVDIVDRAAPAAIPEGNPHMERLAIASGAPRTSKQAWTDVARLTERGVGAVNFGPGETAQAHKAGEYVTLDNMFGAYRALRTFLTT